MPVYLQIEEKMLKGVEGGTRMDAAVDILPPKVRKKMTAAAQVEYVDHPNIWYLFMMVEIAA